MSANILVIEDDIYIQELIKEFLSGLRVERDPISGNVGSKI